MCLCARAVVCASAESVLVKTNKEINFVVDRNVVSVHDACRNVLENHF